MKKAGMILVVASGSSFGSIFPGANSNIESVLMNITGSFENECNKTIAIYINGSGWITGNNSFSAGNTSYGLTIPPSSALSEAQNLLGNFEAGNYAIYFSLAVPFPQAPGNYSQDITFTGVY